MGLRTGSGPTKLESKNNFLPGSLQYKPFLLHISRHFSIVVPFATKSNFVWISHCKKLIFWTMERALSKNPNMSPQTLPHNFGLMESTFGGKVNRNSGRKDEAQSVGSYLDSYICKPL